jgi:glycosyltransferase involved in cell wall biosynthesis
MDHVNICICTYQRPEYLARLLSSLTELETGGLFTWSVVVVDNDRERSAEPVVSRFRDESGTDVIYDVEPEQNIALARNRVVSHVSGTHLAFIDDDEFPGPGWLLELYNTMGREGADGTLGPVLPHYEETPPGWIIKGKFFDRPSHDTGEVLTWHNTRTGNVLLKSSLLTEETPVFNPRLLTGEDRDFFRRMIARGHGFVWCAEAPVYEHVPAIRMTRSFMLRRALFRGKVSIHYANISDKDVLKSLVAVTLYTAMLPILLLAGHHHFMKYLVKDCDHLGRIMARFGVELVKDRYVTE